MELFFCIPSELELFLEGRLRAHPVYMERLCLRTRVPRTMPEDSTESETHDIGKKLCRAGNLSFECATAALTLLGKAVLFQPGQKSQIYKTHET